MPHVEQQQQQQQQQATAAAAEVAVYKWNEKMLYDTRSIYVKY